jgi:hypothetical protein
MADVSPKSTVATAFRCSYCQRDFTKKEHLKVLQVHHRNATSAKDPLET